MPKLSFPEVPKLSKLTTFIATLGFFSLSLHGSEAKQSPFPLKLRSHEPNLIGYRKDSNDVAFMDFKLSLMYPMLHDGSVMGAKQQSYLIGWLPYPYIAFTGRFGQYIGSRNSSPVIAKQFNPKIFGRYWLNTKGSYLDISYEHESNGQSINTGNAFARKRSDLINDGENPDFAQDYISRGWDFIGIKIEKVVRWKRWKGIGSLKFKNFLKDGLLQGSQEEPEAWEGITKGHPRSRYDGLQLSLEQAINFNLGPIRGTGSHFIYTTGYNNPTTHNTYQLNLTTVWWDFPLTLWGRTGYNSDLADYYQKSDSFGVAFELKSLVE